MTIARTACTHEQLQNYDVVVVGAGFAGAVCARQIAEKLGKSVAVLEIRDHVAGNAYDRKDEAGILIHQYGPHIFHTDNNEVFEYLSRFTQWDAYEHRVLANVHGELMPVPFNRTSLSIAFGRERGESLYKKLVDTFGEHKKVRIMDLRDASDPDLAEVADYVYENIFLHYTLKQWGQTPDEVDPSVTGRVPIMISDDDRYFQNTHQGMPKDGYTSIFDNMLEHELIDVFLNTDARQFISIQDGELKLGDQRFSGDVVYSGPLDELFGLQFGALPYRSLDLDFETLTIDRFQSVGTVNYTTEEEPFTRITEFKNLTGQKVPGATTILREFSQEYAPGRGQTPYYAIISDENMKMYQQYRKLVDEVPSFWVVGRLAEYRYYDMDAVCESALALAKKIINVRGA